MKHLIVAAILLVTMPAILAEEQPADAILLENEKLLDLVTTALDAAAQANQDHAETLAQYAALKQHIDQWIAAYRRLEAECRNLRDTLKNYKNIFAALDNLAPIGATSAKDAPTLTPAEIAQMEPYQRRELPGRRVDVQLAVILSEPRPSGFYRIVTVDTAGTRRTPGSPATSYVYQGQTVQIRCILQAEQPTALKLSDDPRRPTKLHISGLIESLSVKPAGKIDPIQTIYLTLVQVKAIQ